MDVTSLQAAEALQLCCCVFAGLIQMLAAVPLLPLPLPFWTC